VVAELPTVVPAVAPPVAFEVPPIAEAPPVVDEPPLDRLPPVLLEPPGAELLPATELLPAAELPPELVTPPEPELPPVADWPPDPLPTLELAPPLPPEPEGSSFDWEQPADAAMVKSAANKTVDVVFIICSMACAPTFYSLFCNTSPPPAAN
jgi:hypothetical protein